MTTKIYALHGFLGLPCDWDSIEKGMQPPFRALDPFSLSHPKNGLLDWGRALNRWVAKQPEEKRVLIGYSQGGRLALHALIDAPKLWAGAIIVSANTGLTSPEERMSRLQTDAEWARRFLNDPWEKIIDDWNGQAAFQGQNPVFHRKEEDFTREDLASGLEGWSLGKQADLKEELSKLPLPILWVAGEKDLKYAALAKQMGAIPPHSSVWIAPKTGHRVPWECPELFFKESNLWMQRLAFLESSDCPA